MQLKDMSNNIIQRLLKANIARTRYMLQNYLKYSKTQAAEVEIQTSRGILGIISDSIGNKTDFSDADKSLIDRCGSIICSGLQQILYELRDFPWNIGQNSYLLLYEKYFRDEGTINTFQLKERLQLSGLFFSEYQIEEQLDIAERMMTALIFENRLLYACVFGRNQSILSGQI